MNTANMPEQFPVYSVISSDDIEVLERKLEQYLKNITAVLGINNTQEILCDQLTMHEICDRVQRRRVYSHIFHGSREGNSMKMGELNEGSLLCFWILKLMPFKHDTIPSTGLNVKIATTVFINTLHYVAAKSKKRVNIKGGYTDSLMYFFAYRNLSKEAVMLLAESLVC